MLKYDDSKQMTLGQLIYQLEEIEDKDKKVYYDFGHCVPDEFRSWRGSYDLLSLGFNAYESSEFKEISVKELLNKARKVEGQEFTGYKGGSFWYDHSHKIWVADYGSSGWTGLCGVLETRSMVVLQTCYTEYY